MAASLAAALILGGCGSSEPDAGSDTTKVNKAARPAPRADAVAAVSGSKAPAAVELRFVIPEAPVVGQPLAIQLTLTPMVELERLVARFQVPEGLELVSGAETGRLDHPAPGTEISHTLTVRPKADGIYNITAVVVTDSATESVARTFSIPLIAGAGFPELPPAANASPPRP